MVKRIWFLTDFGTNWISYTPETGYLIFPAELDGWSKRKSFRGFAPYGLERSPVRFQY